MESKCLSGTLPHPGEEIGVIKSCAFTFWFIVKELQAADVLYVQGLGLFAARDIEKQAMVIEYNGTVLRNEVAIRKEKIYSSQVFILIFLVNKVIFLFMKAKTCPCSVLEPSRVHVPHRQRTCCRCNSKWRACKVLLN